MLAEQESYSTGLVAVIQVCGIRACADSTHVALLLLYLLNLFYCKPSPACTLTCVDLCTFLRIGSGSGSVFPSLGSILLQVLVVTFCGSCSSLRLDLYRISGQTANVAFHVIHVHTPLTSWREPVFATGILIKEFGCCQK
ncbi:hypothetical protein [Burkholderia phage vB_BpP_HN05]